MSENDLKSIAVQLRKPGGSLGIEVGRMMNNGNKLMNLTTIDQLEIQPNDKILEIGMGNGFFVKYVLEKAEAVQYIGCDYSDEMIAEAFNCNIDFIKRGQVQFTRASINKLPYKNEHFNKVFTVNTIYFWDQVETALSEVKRVLKSHGQLIISLRPKSVMDRLPVTSYGFTTFSMDDCIALLNRNGFEITNVIEREDSDIELLGKKFQNAFMIVKATKK